MAERKCALCGETFSIVGRNTRQKYCSSSCRRKRWQRENKDYGREKMRLFRENNPGYLGPKRQANVDRVNEIKESNPCVDCGGVFPACCMDFDHRDTDKHDEVGTLISRSRPWDVIESEIAKCDLVCANCHRIRTRDKGSSGWTRQTTLEKDEMPKTVAQQQALAA